MAKETKKKYGLGRSAGKTRELNLPSGEVCLVRNVSIEELMELGILDDMDSLSGIVQTEHIDRVAGKTKAQTLAESLAGLDASSPEGRAALLEIVKDKERWTKLIAFVNKVALRAVVEPAVYDRDAADGVHAVHMPTHDAVAIQEVDLTDRLAIMTAALSAMRAGVQAVEPFREGRPGDVADVPDGPGLLDPTLYAAGGHEPASS